MKTTESRSRISTQKVVDNKFALPPWPEWSDKDLSEVQWNPSSKNLVNQKACTRSSETPQWFQDPMGHAQLPSSLKAEEWIRLASIANVTVFDAHTFDVKMLDLVSPNSHLLHSEVMRWILAGIMSLYQRGRSSKLVLQGQGDVFTTPPGPWKPWNYVYSLCKESKASVRKTLVNPFGKYIVRLFYMGRWRRITVDDYIPLDTENQILLPMSSSGTELWPVLLAKALLKVASLSWNEEREIRHFSVITCLTGWYAQELDLQQVPSNTVWGLCHTLLMAQSGNFEARFAGVTDANVNEAYDLLGLIPAQDTICQSNQLDPYAEVLSAVVVVAVIDTNGTTLDYAEHPVILTEARNECVVEEDRPQIPAWKTFRWKKWAIEQGIIKDDSLICAKYIRMFCPFQTLTPEPTNRLEMLIASTNVADKPSEVFKIQKSKSKLRKGELKIKNIQDSELTDNSIYPEYWTDFDNLFRILKRFEIYYSTSSFQYNVEVADISQFLVHKPASIPISKKPPSKEVKRITSMSNVRSSSKIKPLPPLLYMLVDSMYCKKLFVCLSVLRPTATVESFLTHADEETDVPMYYIMGEEYDWQANNVGAITFAVKSAGTTSQLIELREGLSVFRLWAKLPDIYSIQILSQAPCILGTLDTIQERLTGDSVSWKYFGSRFSSAFNALSTMPAGCTNHLELVENLFKAYLPLLLPKSRSRIFMKLKSAIQDRFEHVLVELLLEKTQDIDIITQTILEWRWLFMKSEFGRKALRCIPGGDVNIHEIWGSILSSSSNYSRNSKTSGIRASILEHPFDIDETLYKNNRLNMISFNDQTGTDFMKRMFEIGDEIKFYPFSDDNKHQICCIDYKGIARNSVHEWVPLVRFVVNTHGNQNPLCSVLLNTTLPGAVLQVINNDNLKPFPRFLDGIESSYLPTNRLGYTIFASGSISQSSEMRDHPWKIRITSKVDEHMPHACYMMTNGQCSPIQPPPLSIIEVKDYYIPNKNRIIFKCLLTVHVTQPITIRTTMSKKDVEYTLSIRDNNDDIIKEYSAVGEKIIPVVALIGKESDGPDFYIIEAHDLKKAWKLSREETAIVNSLREMTGEARLVFSCEKSVRMASQMKIHKPVSWPFDSSTSNIKLEETAPFWSLMLVVDQELSCNVTIEQDRRAEEKIRRNKEEREAADPGRCKRGSKLRHEFLERNLYCKGVDTRNAASESKLKILLQDNSIKGSDTVTVSDEIYQSEKLKQKMQCMKEFEEEYGNIRTQYENINSQSARREKKLKEFLAEITRKSLEMKTVAYNERNKCVERIMGNSGRVKKKLDPKRK